MEIEDIEKHLKSHSKSSADDNAAVSTLEYFLSSNGKINTQFAKNDKWPNIDGYFELVPNPTVSRKPFQNFFVQIKGTNLDNFDNEGCFKYQLNSLGFPAYCLSNVTSDPCILFVISNISERSGQKIFWKYMSFDMLSKIDFTKESCVIKFNKEDEILNTDESISDFVSKLVKITERHSFVKKLSATKYKEKDIIEIIKKCDEDICEIIEEFNPVDKTREIISKKLITKLYDLCYSSLLYNAIKEGFLTPTPQIAWDISLMNINTKFMSTFLRALEYLDRRIPEDGQNERLMLKYYDYMWQIRQYFIENFNLKILDNLEKFPTEMDKEDSDYFSLIAPIIDENCNKPAGYTKTRFVVVNKQPFYVGKNRYFEITLQLAGKYASKYNRVTIYSKKDISTSYSIQIAYIESSITFWEKPSFIRIVTDWKVSIDPSILNKIGLMFDKEIKLSSNYGEYSSLMKFLTDSSANLLDIIDLKDIQYKK